MHRELSVAVGLALVAGGLLAGPAVAADQGPSCGGKKATIVGTAKSETIKGTAKNDVIHGRGGNDKIDGGGGNDIICGGGGNDDLAGGNGNDRIVGGRGADDIDGGGGNDKVFGAKGYDRMQGGEGDDSVYGGPGVDRCRQNAGSGPVKACEDKPLVVAFINDDGAAGYAKGKDTLIAGIFDADGDKKISVGDEIRTDRYPLDIEGEARGRFGVRNHVVTAVNGIAARNAPARAGAPRNARVAASDYRYVQVESGDSWFHFEEYDESDFEDWSWTYYQEYDPNTSAYSWFSEEDWYFSGDEVYRSLYADPGSPSAPATAGEASDLSASAGGDWLEIEFFVDTPSE